FNRHTSRWCSYGEDGFHFTYFTTLKNDLIFRERLEARAFDAENVFAGSNVSKRRNTVAVGYRGGNDLRRVRCTHKRTTCSGEKMPLRIRHRYSETASQCLTV